MKTVTSAAVFTLHLVLTAGALYAQAQNARGLIEQEYRSADAAYGRSDAAGCAGSLAPTVTITDSTGSVRRLTRAEVVSSLSKDLRDVPGHRIVRRQITTLSSVATADKQSVVRGTMIRELVGESPAGSVVSIRTTILFQDHWINSGGTWQSDATQLVSPIERIAKATPSPKVMSMLRQMQTSEAQLREFNRANNTSTCMTSSANEKYDYETRKAYCSQ